MIYISIFALKTVIFSSNILMSISFCYFFSNLWGEIKHIKFNRLRAGLAETACVKRAVLCLGQGSQPVGCHSMTCLFHGPFWPTTETARDRLMSCRHSTAHWPAICRSHQNSDDHLNFICSCYGISCSVQLLTCF
jgi:hypothetical protein